jgi:hypothetical protein
VLVGGINVKAVVSPWFTNGNVLDFVGRYPDEANRMLLVCPFDHWLWLQQLTQTS